MTDEKPQPKQQTAATETADEQSQPVVSTPQPVERGAPAPETTEDEDWELGTWAGLPQWTCKLKVRHAAANDTSYDLPCNRTYFSHEELMEHFRNHG